MKNWLVSQLLRVALPKLARHAALVIGTWLSAHGQTGSGSVSEVLTGGIVICLSIAWSYAARWQHIGMLEPLTVHARALAEILVRAALTTGAAMLSIPPEQLSSMSTEGLLVVLANIALSAMSDTKPDARKATLA